MGVRQYKVGKQHGLQGIRFLAHRNGRAYCEGHAKESYRRGYYDGAKERGTPRLDYSQPLNNRQFT